MAADGLTSEQVETRVNKSAASLNQCYERGLKRNEDLAGLIRVKFVISEKGSVESASIEETEMKDKQVENCILAKIKTWKFPKPVGGVTVTSTYPFKFSRQKPKK